MATGLPGPPFFSFLPPSVTSTSISIPTPTAPTTTPTTSSTTSTASTSSPSSSSSASTASTDSKTSSSTTASTTASSTTSAVSTTPSTSIPDITAPSSIPNIPAVVTEVSTTFVSQTPSNTPTAAVVNNNTTGNAFFQDKGAVAGVFSVVGLVGLVILIALIVNFIRRRQARKFDKELFLATQEAAATAPNLNFLDDEDDERKPNNGYSDVSHGTYGQPQMEAFTRGPGVGEIFTRNPYPGIGAGGARYPDEGESPYPQFMGQRDRYGGPFGRGTDLGATVIPSAQSPYFPAQDPTNLPRSKSTSTAATHPSIPSLTSNYTQASYPVGQTTPIHPSPHTEKAPSGGSADDAAYAGYVDDVEEEAPKRVLKIANES